MAIRPGRFSGGWTQKRPVTANRKADSYRPGHTYVTESLWGAELYNLGAVSIATTSIIGIMGPIDCPIDRGMFQHWLSERTRTPPSARFPPELTLKSGRKGSVASTRIGQFYGDGRD